MEGNSWQKLATEQVFEAAEKRGPRESATPRLKPGVSLMYVLKQKQIDRGERMLKIHCSISLKGFLTKWCV